MKIILKIIKQYRFREVFFKVIDALRKAGEV